MTPHAIALLLDGLTVFVAEKRSDWHDVGCRELLSNVPLATSVDYSECLSVIQGDEDMNPLSISNDGLLVEFRRVEWPGQLVAEIPR